MVLKTLSKRAQTVLDNYDASLADIASFTLQQLRTLRGCGLKTALELDAHRPSDWVEFHKFLKRYKRKGPLVKGPFG